MNNIKSLRVASGMSQRDLANEMNISQQAVARWERGDSMPRADQLPRLADLLNCTIDALFGRDTA